MQKHCLLFILAVAVFLCGCGKQEKINSQKIDLLSQKVLQLEKSETMQMTTIQSELNSLAPMLDKMNNSYFEKNRDDALFFHTNTLYLLLTIGKQIETQLETADSERVAEHALMYSYHTNELTTMYLCTAQLENVIAEQQSKLQSNLTFEVEQANEETAEKLSKQIQSLAPDSVEIARRKDLETRVTQLQRDLDLIKSRLGITNQLVN